MLQLLLLQIVVGAVAIAVVGVVVVAAVVADDLAVAVVAVVVVLVYVDMSVDADAATDVGVDVSFAQVPEGEASGVPNPARGGSRGEPNRSAGGSRAAATGKCLSVWLSIAFKPRRFTWYCGTDVSICFQSFCSQNYYQWPVSFTRRTNRQLDRL